MWGEVDASHDEDLSFEDTACEDRVRNVMVRLKEFFQPNLEACLPRAIEGAVYREHCQGRGCFEKVLHRIPTNQDPASLRKGEKVIMSTFMWLMALRARTWAVQEEAGSSGSACRGSENSSNAQEVGSVVEFLSATDGQRREVARFTKA